MKDIFLSKKIIFLVLSVCHGVSMATSLAQAAAGDPVKGQLIYEASCSGCHGKEGDGEGLAAKFLDPRPRNFTAGIFKYKSTEGEGMPSDEDLFRRITNGLPGTGMPSWDDILSEQEKWDVIAYEKLFAKDEFEEFKTETIDYSGVVPSSPESIAKGRNLFLNKARCNECHGEEGRGDAIKSLKDEIYFMRLWPRNLTQPWTFRVGGAAKDIFTRITVGIPGTPMPSFSEIADPLTKEERWHVANYIVSIADPIKKVDKEKNTVHSDSVDRIPTEINSPVWDSVEGLVIQMLRQIPGKKRMFVPVNITVLVKSVFDEKRIVFLLEWDDRTPSIEGDNVVLRLSEALELYQDAVAIQFPQVIPDPLEKPKYFGHGGKKTSANILYWSAGTTEKRNVAKIHDTVSEGKIKGRNSTGGPGFSTEGERKLKSRISVKRSGFTAVGKYRKGVWKVMMSRDITTKVSTDLQFGKVKYIPIMLANWDGSKRERGNKHSVSGWYWLSLGESDGQGEFSSSSEKEEIVKPRDLPNALGKKVKKEKESIRSKRKLFSVLSSYLILRKFEMIDMEKHLEATELWGKGASKWAPEDEKKANDLILWIKNQEDQ